MKQIIRNAEVYVQIHRTRTDKQEIAEIELDRILNPHIGKELTPEILVQLSSFIDEFKVGVNVFTDVDVDKPIEKIFFELKVNADE